jgi:hypothetical protein
VSELAALEAWEAELAAEADQALEELEAAQTDLEAAGQALARLTTPAAWDGAALAAYWAALARVREAGERLDAWVVFAPAGWSRRRSITAR